MVVDDGKSEMVKIGEIGERIIIGVSGEELGSVLRYWDWELAWRCLVGS